MVTNSYNCSGRKLDNVVPKKLVVGMKVVVMFKPSYELLCWEHEAGVVTGKWIKMELTHVTSDGWFAAIFNGERIVWSSANAIIIRSTAYDPSAKPSVVRRKLESDARRQRREIVESVKVVSYKIGNKLYKC